MSSKPSDNSLKGQEIQKRTIFKPLLTNPYTRRNIWPRIEPNLQLTLLQALETDILTSIKQWNNLSIEEKKSLPDITKQSMINDIGNVLYGFNSIMKSLEDQISKKDLENKIKVLFVCKYDISSKLLYDHFPVLCSLANVKLITLPKNSSKKLSIALGVKKDIQFLALREGIIKNNKFISLTLDSTIDDINIGFLNNQNYNYEDKKLEMNVKFLLTEMPIVKKKNDKKK